VLNYLNYKYGNYSYIYFVVSYGFNTIWIRQNRYNYNFHIYNLNNSTPFTNVFVTFPWSFLFSIEVFLDFEINFSFITIQGLFMSTIQKSALLPIVRLPLLIFKILAGLDVKA
jgi:thiamine transporter ThiT